MAGLKKLNVAINAKINVSRDTVIIVNIDYLNNEIHEKLLILKLQMLFQL
jgi:hypothetical protein